MAYCVEIPVPGGGRALVRMSGKKPAPCLFCGKRPHTKLCDALVPGLPGEKPHSCDAKLCDGCAIPSGKQDFCPAHKELA